MTHPGRTLKKGAVLAEASYRDADTEDNAKVDVKAHVTVDIAFGQVPGRSFPVALGASTISTFAASPWSASLGA